MGRALLEFASPQDAPALARIISRGGPTGAATDESSRSGHRPDAGSDALAAVGHRVRCPATARRETAEARRWILPTPSPCAVSSDLAARGSAPISSPRAGRSAAARWPWRRSLAFVVGIDGRTRRRRAVSRRRRRRATAPPRPAAAPRRRRGARCRAGRPRSPKPIDDAAGRRRRTRPARSARRRIARGSDRTGHHSSNERQTAMAAWRVEGAGMRGTVRWWSLAGAIGCSSLASVRRRGRTADEDALIRRGDRAAQARRRSRRARRASSAPTRSRAARAPPPSSASSEQALGLWPQAEAHVREALAAPGRPVDSQEPRDRRGVAAPRSAPTSGGSRSRAAEPGAQVRSTASRSARCRCADAVPVSAGPVDIEVRGAGYRAGAEDGERRGRRATRASRSRCGRSRRRPAPDAAAGVATAALRAGARSTACPPRAPGSAPRSSRRVAPTPGAAGASAESASSRAASRPSAAASRRRSSGRTSSTRSARTPRPIAPTTRATATGRATRPPPRRSTSWAAPRSWAASSSTSRVGRRPKRAGRAAVSSVALRPVVAPAEPGATLSVRF